MTDDIASLYGLGADTHPHLRDYFLINNGDWSLDRCIRISLETLGFFSTHPPRALEYPWMLETLSTIEGRFLDVGAGVSPIPFALSAVGKEVLTIDYSSLIRTLESKDKWNEWGFLDYSLINRNIQSFNMDIQEANLPVGGLDCVYSISVIEHMPASIRRATIKKASYALRNRGRLIVTLDLIPDSSLLWNRDRGETVEDPSAHGTLGDFVNELESQNIVVDDLDIKRGLPGAWTDIAFVTASKIEKRAVA